MALPLKPVPATKKDPDNLIMFGLPKVGKTTLLATLPKCLILDFEDGSDYIEGLKLKIKTLKEFKELLDDLAAYVEKHKTSPYDFFAIDTITAFEEFAKPLALKRFKNSKDGLDFTGTDVTKDAGFSGRRALNDAMKELIDMLKPFGKTIIVAHVKDKAVFKKDGDETALMKDMDLVSNLRNEFVRYSDAFGYIFRDEESNLCLNFEATSGVAAGARPQHLANKRIIVAEKQEDKDGNITFVSHWDRIYPSLATTTKK